MTVADHVDASPTLTLIVISRIDGPVPVTMGGTGSNTVLSPAPGAGITAAVRFPSASDRKI